MSVLTSSRSVSYTDLGMLRSSALVGFPFPNRPSSAVPSLRLHEEEDDAGGNQPLNNKTLLGWTANADNIGQLTNAVKEHVTHGASAFVFDLFGNTSVRFKQFDGSMSLPFQSHGKFHLGGKVIICPPDIFKQTVECLADI